MVLGEVVSDTSEMRDPWESPCYIGGGSLGDEIPAKDEPEAAKTYQDYLKSFEIEFNAGVAQR